MGLLRIENLNYSYRKGDYVLKDVNLEFNKGSMYAITGKSGSGKTTLLSLLSGLDTPKGGRILYNEKDIKRINKYRFRSRDIGVVFQSFNLLYQLTALENVILSIDISGKRVKRKKAFALDLLERVGIDKEKARRRVLKLSGGEQQRVAIARTLSYNPDVILADEPTGNLDRSNENAIMDILDNLAKKDNKCIIIVTHSPTVAERVDVVYPLSNEM